MDHSRDACFFKWNEINNTERLKSLTDIFCRCKFLEAKLRVLMNMATPLNSLFF